MIDKVKEKLQPAIDFMKAHWIKLTIAFVLGIIAHGVLKSIM